MTLHIENDEIEKLLTELETGSGRGREAVLLDLLRKERERLGELERRIAEGLRIDEELRQSWKGRPVIDARSPDEILGYDENGLPS